jgi:predicted phosphodiesterase
MAERKYTDQEIAFIIGLKEGDKLGWDEIADKFNDKFDAASNSESIKQLYHRYKHMFDKEDYQVKVLKDIHRTRKNNSYTSRDYKQVLDAWNQRDDILEAISNAAKDINKGLKKNPIQVKPIKANPKDKKPPMTKELLISDIHFGKKVEFEGKVSFDLEILKRRLKEVTDVTLKEIERDSAHYTVERVIIALLGDIIESSTMHGLESAKGCEFGNSRQIYEAMKNLFNLVIRPIAETGIPVHIPAVCGNHDRTEHERTFNNPGEENVTYIIYHGMKQFCELAGLTNVTWDIPTGPSAIVEIYGKNALYEHGDNAQGPGRKALEDLMTKRANQARKPIEWLRVGHFHCETSYGMYKIIINGSGPGDDSYSLVKGFMSEATQVLNSYVKTTRPNPFYKCLSIQLDHIK